jgi:Domain of unknown function (DUF4232)
VDHGAVRGRRPIALVVLVGLAAGCGSGSKRQNTTTTVAPAVPWTAKRPPEVAERTPAAAACRSSDLRIERQVKFVPRLEGGIALVPIRNVGRRACRLTGRPRVRFVHDGGPIQVQRTIPRTPAEFPEVTYPDSSLLALAPGESAAVTVTWDNWCDPLVAGKPHVPPSAIRLTLPGGRGSLDADYNAVVRCLDLNAPTTIGVSTFQPSLVPAGRRWTDAFVSATVPTRPLHARRGGLLRYRVVLRNRSNTAATFDRCPAYIQQLVPAGKVETYQVNCAAARPIAPGKTLALAMQIRVPKDSPLGGNGLFWELDPFGTQGPQAHVRVTVVR